MCLHLLFTQKQPTLPQTHEVSNTSLTTVRKESSSFGDVTTRTKLMTITTLQNTLAVAFSDVDENGDDDANENVIPLRTCKCLSLIHI